MRKVWILVLVALACPLLAGSRPKAREHYEKGLQKLRQDDYKKAAKEFQKAAKEDPTWADAHFQLAMVYVSLGKWKDAERSNRRALALDADLPDARYWADIFEDRRRLADCILFTEDQKYGPAASLLSVYLNGGGDLKRFHEVFRNSYLNPDPVILEWVRSLARKQDLERLEATIAAWQEASARDSGGLFSETFNVLAEMDQAESLALKWSDYWMAKAPEDILTALASRGWFLVQKGREEEARDVYGRLLQALLNQPGLVVDAGAKSLVLHFGGTFEEPQVKNSFNPNYTDAAIDAKVTGLVLFQGVVGTDGQLRDLRQLRQPLGYGLDESALEGFAHWSFVPARINGIPVSMRIMMEVTFSLR